ncbi:MAG: hypothetical protein LBD50_03085 [Rickettsiales bacterium]|jgi:hypothetical protein|nr:hypothetical protein [Rickettsiales bacterium]
MQLKTFGLLTLASILAFSANAQAEMLYDFYGGVAVGAGAATIFVSHENETVSAQSYGLAFGVDIPLVRLEAEYGFLNDDSAKLHAGMANIYFKMPSTVIIPYLGVGVGGIFGGHADNLDIKTKAAYQGMLGLTFDMVALPFKLDGEARALYAPDFYSAAGVKPDLLHYDLRIKLRYIF